MRVYVVGVNRMLKGVADGGISVPHSETRFYDYDRDRIFDKHVADYMKHLETDDETAYKRQFSKFIENGITSKSLEGMYKSAHEAIRKNPEHVVKPKKERKPEDQKRFNAKKSTHRERKHRVSNKKAYLLHPKDLQETQ